MIKEIHSRYSCGDNFSEAGRLQKLFRHLIQRGNTLFQPVKLSCGILNRLQVKDNVSGGEMTPASIGAEQQISISGGCQSPI